MNIGLIKKIKVDIVLKEGALEFDLLNSLEIKVTHEVFVLLEDVLLLELVLLLGDDSRQFEEQPHIINIVSSDAPSRWESQQLIFEPISREKSHPVHHTLVVNKTPDREYLTTTG